MGRKPMSEEDKAKPSDRITCDVCGIEYSRSNKCRHVLSKIHKLAEKIVGGHEKRVKRKKHHIQDNDSDDDDVEKQVKWITMDDLRRRKQVGGTTNNNEYDILMKYVKDRYGNVMLQEAERIELEEFLRDMAQPIGAKYKAIDIAVNEWQPPEYINKTPNRYPDNK